MDEPTASPTGPAALLTRPQRLAVTVTAVLVALTRLPALAQGPWDWDEVLFCLALGDYDVARHQPHPAGFPLYILLGHLARFFTGSDFHALQVVNVLAAMAVFPLSFLLARAFRFDFTGAFSAALLIAFLPNVWFYGGTAFSDLPAVVLYLAAIACYLLAGDSARRYLLASVVLGAAVLIRPQSALLAVFAWALASVRLVRAKRIGAALGANAVLLAVVAIGYGIAAWLTGVDAYVSALEQHRAYVRHYDTYASPDRPALEDIALTQLDPYDAGKVSILLNALALLALLAGRRRPVLEIVLTFLPYFVFTMFAANPLGSSRFSLGYMPGIALLAVEGTRAIARAVPRFEIVLRVAVMAVLVGRFATWTYPAFAVPRTTDAPPAQAALWLARHVPETSTIFVEANIWPWARYYLPRHRRVGVEQGAPIVNHPGARDGWYLCNETTNNAAAIVFRRPRNRTWNIVTQRCFESYVMPAQSVVVFARGWHMQEEDANESWRWSMGKAVMKLGPAGPGARLDLRFNVPYDAVQRPIRVTFTFNGQPLGVVTATRNEQEVHYVVDARGDGENVLGIDVDPPFVPAQHGGHDTRELGIMLRSYVWRPAP